MAKLTQKEKLLKANMFLCSMEGTLHRLQWFARDFHSDEITRISKDLESKIEDFKKQIRN